MGLRLPLFERLAMLLAASIVTLPILIERFRNILEIRERFLAKHQTLYSILYIVSTPAKCTNISRSYGSCDATVSSKRRKSEITYSSFAGVHSPSHPYQSLKG